MSDCRCPFEVDRDFYGIEMALKGIGGGGESCIKRQIIPDCGGKVAEGSFAKFSGEQLTWFRVFKVTGEGQGYLVSYEVNYLIICFSVSKSLCHT